MCACMEPKSEFEPGIQFFQTYWRQIKMYNTLERFVRVFSCLMCSSLTMERRRRGRMRKRRRRRGEV